MKTCVKCGIEKPLIEGFHAAKRNSDGRRISCKECCNAVMRANRAANPEKYREREARYYRANPDGKLERNATWRKANPEKVIEQGTRWRNENPEKVKAIKSRWHENHREAYRAYVAKRALLRRGYTGLHHTGGDVMLLLEAQHGLCAYCGKALETYHVDHILPLSRGGGNGPDNICIACPACNLSKGNKLFLVEWVAA